MNEAGGPCEVSVVMPCLNEADTIGTCVEKAIRALRESGVAAEVVVSDNGSTDQSAEKAAKAGARVVNVKERGYGHALMGGIAAARGKYILIGDADDSYDFGEAARFVEKLREGYELVQGCRLPSGGGKVLDGAMPGLHRWFGNPFFSALGRAWFGSPLHDVNCGMRALTRGLYDRLDLQCTGMEFAVEMIIKSALLGVRTAEIPVTLHPDGRKSHAPHLRTFRDGWRTLRLFLIYTPRWLFLVPGLALTLVGVAGYGLALPNLTIRGVEFDVHTLVVSSLAILCGYQTLLLAVFAKTFAVAERMMPTDPGLERFFRVVSLERGLLVALLALFAGLGMIALAALEWRARGFGHMDYRHTMRQVVPGATLAALGFQTVTSSFLIAILRMGRR